MPIQQITIVGTGLIGGSLGLALKQAGFAGEIVGSDRRAVLDVAASRGAIDRAEADLKQAIVGSDVIVLATPVGCILAQLETIAPLVPPTTLITDAGSTKQRFVERARELFGDASRPACPARPSHGRQGIRRHRTRRRLPLPRRSLAGYSYRRRPKTTLRASRSISSCWGRSALARSPWMPSGMIASAPGSAICPR